MTTTNKTLTSSLLHNLSTSEQIKKEIVELKKKIQEDLNSASNDFANKFYSMGNLFIKYAKQKEEALKALELELAEILKEETAEQKTEEPKKRIFSFFPVIEEELWKIIFPKKIYPPTSYFTRTL